MQDATKRRVYVFGNGLSIAYNAEYYALPALTEAVADKLGRIALTNGHILGDDVIATVDRMTTDAQIGTLANLASFEELAGPLERLAASVEHIATLVAVEDDPEIQAALTRIADYTSSLYTRVVGVVLGLVTKHVDHLGDLKVVEGVAAHLVGICQTQNDLDVFVLNYDALLDSGLLAMHEHPLGGRRRDAGFQLTDEFDGRYGGEVLVGNTRVPDLGMREEQYHAYPRLRLFHLHGAATWIRSGDRVSKVRRLQQLRDVDLFDLWAHGGAQNLAPVVVLGDRKDRLVGKAPFDDQYASLRASVASAEVVILAGYVMGDLPLNAAIRSSLRQDARVVIVNPDAAIRARAANALALDDGRVVGILDGLPGGLDHIDEALP